MKLGIIVYPRCKKAKGAYFLSKTISFNNKKSYWSFGEI